MIFKSCVFHSVFEEIFQHIFEDFFWACFNRALSGGAIYSPTPPGFLKTKHQKTSLWVNIKENIIIVEDFIQNVKPIWDLRVWLLHNAWCNTITYFFLMFVLAISAYRNHCNHHSSEKCVVLKIWIHAMERRYTWQHSMHGLRSWVGSMIRLVGATLSQPVEPPEREISRELMDALKNARILTASEVS